MKEGLTLMKYLTIALAAGAALAIVGCGSKGAAPLATINGEDVFTEEYYKTLERLPTVRVQTAQGAQDVQVSESLAFQALKQTVYNKVLLQLAKDEGVYPTSKDILDELEFQKEVDKSFGDRLKQSGLTIDMVKEQILIQLAQEKLVTKGINVTIQDAEKFINDNPKQFMQPATINASWIFVNSDAKKAQADQALSTGQAFSTVAMQYSEAPQAKELGGRFPVERLDTVGPPFDKVLKETKEGTMSEWVKAENSWAKFYIERRTEERPLVVDDLLKRRVRRQLALQRGALAVDLERRVTDKIVASKITIERTDLQEPWKRLVDEVKKQRATVGTTGPTPGSEAGTPPGQ
ncbi:MAG: peptidyl-prolyl cis-trans isomerase [Fimbriimonadaceae bacterium]|nr:peptidyl-prolyl cis-trans isomerase [Fimbriimonadaceae bacterium]